MTRNLAGTGIPPGNGGVTFPSPNEWPTTYVAITGISKGLLTTVTAPSHGITITAGSSTPGVDFSQVRGMQQINGKFGYVSKVVDADTIVVEIDSSFYSNYTSGGFINKTAGSAPIDPLTNTYP